MSDYISLFPRLPRRRDRFIHGDMRIKELEEALLDMTQRRDLLKERNEILIEENKRLRRTLHKTAQELIELALGKKP